MTGGTAGGGGSPRWGSGPAGGGGVEVLGDVLRVAEAAAELGAGVGVVALDDPEDEDHGQHGRHGEPGAVHEFGRADDQGDDAGYEGAEAVYSQVKAPAGCPAAPPVDHH